MEKKLSKEEDVVSFFTMTEDAQHARSGDDSDDTISFTSMSSDLNSDEASTSKRACDSNVNNPILKLWIDGDIVSLQCTYAKVHVSQRTAARTHEKHELCFSQVSILLIKIVQF